MVSSLFRRGEGGAGCGPYVCACTGRRRRAPAPIGLLSFPFQHDLREGRACLKQTQDPTRSNLDQARGLTSRRGRFAGDWAACPQRVKSRRSAKVNAMSALGQKRQSSLARSDWRSVWINQRQGDPVRFDSWLDQTFNLYHRVPR